MNRSFVCIVLDRVQIGRLIYTAPILSQRLFPGHDNLHGGVKHSRLHLAPDHHNLRYTPLPIYSTLGFLCFHDNPPNVSVVRSYNRYNDQHHRNYTVEVHLVETNPRDCRWREELHLTRIMNQNGYKKRHHTAMFPKECWTIREHPKRYNTAVYIKT